MTPMRTPESIARPATPCYAPVAVKLLCETSAQWVEQAVEHFDQVLVDHAHCEKKAAAQALSLLSAFPGEPGLARAMASLAREEAGHLSQVLALVEKRGLALGADGGDPYAQALQAQVRQPARERLLDRLLVSALIEARSEERLSLLAARLRDPALREFYARLAKAERGHGELFLQLARKTAPRSCDSRLAELARIEARLIRTLPIRPAIH
jgi:tRNA-(ms[2]io[6]A)-hydroxylase